MADFKDIASKGFADSIKKMQELLVSNIMDLRKQGMAREEILLVLQALDMEDLILNQLGFQADIDELMSVYEKALTGMEMTGTVTNEVLTSLLEMDRSTFMREAGMMGENIRKQVARGVISGATEREIAEGIFNGAGGVLRSDQAETLANTGLNTFERNVTAEMSNFDPVDATYVYQGVVDDKTRDICLDMVSAGAMTREDIDSQYPGAFGDGGGFNCRHRWARETTSSKKLSNEKGAKSVIQDKQDKGKWRTPQTYQQQVESRG